MPFMATLGLLCKLFLIILMCVFLDKHLFTSGDLLPGIVILHLPAISHNLSTTHQASVQNWDF